MLYSKAADQKAFVAMDIQNGTQVKNLMYASLVPAAKYDKLVAHVKAATKVAKGVIFQIREAGTGGKVLYEGKKSTTKTGMPKNRYNHIYTKLSKLIPNIEAPGNEFHAKYKSGAFMPLTLEKLYDHPTRKGSYIISMMHYYTQNGDLMRDPDMEIIIHPDMEAAEALSFRQDGTVVGGGTYFKEVYTDDFKKVNTYQKKDQNAFLNQWLTNLDKQGFMKVANIKVEKKKAAPKKTGRPTPPEWLFMGGHPTGTSYSDKRKRTGGDYHKVAFLFKGGTITIYDKSPKYAIVHDIAKADQVKLKAQLLKDRKANQLLEAGSLGFVAFTSGKKRVPAQDKSLVKFFKGRKVGETPEGEASTIAIMEAWNKGWDTANLKAPVSKRVPKNC
jgi:hypothetical protein